MKRVLISLGALCMLVFSALAQQQINEQINEQSLLELRKSCSDLRLAVNPVTDFDCPDPSVVQIGEWFYCFKTGYPMKIYRSRDLVNWEYYRDMFKGPSYLDPFGDGVLDPMHTGVKPGQKINYWAPSAAIIQGKLVVYVTLFVSMENDRQVVCVADDIDSDFKYAGTLNVGTPEHPTPQDGQYFLDDDGRHYLVYGDVNSKGNYIRELAEDGLSYKAGSEPAYITTAYEGGYVYKHGGKYYFFCSKNHFNTYEYTLCMSVSDSLMGGWSEPEPVLVSAGPDAVLNGAGHNGEIIKDRQGRLFMLMHTHCEGLIPRRGDYRPRPMLLMELREVDGRLTFVDRIGAPTKNPQWLVNAPDLCELRSNSITDEAGIGDNEKTIRLLEMLSSHKYGSSDAASVVDAFYINCFSEILLTADGALAEVVGDYCMRIVNNSPDYAISFLKSNDEIRNAFINHIGYQIYFSQDPNGDYGDLTKSLKVDKSFAKDFVGAIKKYVRRITSPSSQVPE